MRLGWEGKGIEISNKSIAWEWEWDENGNDSTGNGRESEQDKSFSRAFTMR